MTRPPIELSAGQLKSIRNYVQNLVQWMVYSGVESNWYNDVFLQCRTVILYQNVCSNFVQQFVQWDRKYAKPRVREQGLTATQSSIRQHLKRLQTNSIKSKAKQENRDVQTITSEYLKVLPKCANWKSTSAQQQQEKQAGKNNEDELLLMMNLDRKT